MTDRSSNAGNRIDIYVDSSWDNGRDSGRRSGGWGAVVVETQGGSRHQREISGGVGPDIDTSVKAEIYGALQALLEVTTAPCGIRICMYTDCEPLIKASRNILESRRYAHANRYGEVFPTLIELVKKRNVAIYHEKDSIYTDIGNILLKAHNLANKARIKAFNENSSEIMKMDKPNHYGNSR